MRFIIYGAGAIGGTIGARLFQNNHEVILIARGPHLDLLRERGLFFETPNESVTLKIPCAGHPSEIDFQQDDVVLLTMKTQHSRDAMLALRAEAGDQLPVVCCQNGVANERMALRIFSRVYAMVVMLPATHLEPGVVRNETKTTSGILDAGCYPNGTDGIIEAVTTALSLSNFSALPDPTVMRYKYAKLLMNLGNGLQALCGNLGPDAADISRMMTREALACYKAAGIDCASRDEFAARRGDYIQVGEIKGDRRRGGSSWQSIARGKGDIEADYLNGEISLIGRLHKVPTPGNTTLQFLANRLAKEKGEPGKFSIDEIRNFIIKAGGSFDQPARG